MEALRIAELISKHLSNTEELNDAERVALDAWLSASEANRRLLEELKDTAKQQQVVQQIHDFSQESTLERILSTQQRRTVFPIRQALPWLVGAAALLLISLGLYFELHRTSQFDKLAPEMVADVAPGANRATLTLADGRTLVLDSTQSGIVVSSEDITYADGRGLMERDNKKELTQEAAAVVDYQLSTPKGGQYQVVLPDGTKVWLNAASTLTYPSRFTGDNREVHLEGEAYFAIAKTKMVQPFIVKSSHQEVTALGTEFNINSYNQETKTTLTEGKIKVASYAVNAQGVSDKEQQPISLEILTPGQQAINSNGQIKVQNVNTESQIAWKSGLFDFTGSSLPEVMKQLEHWYDIEVVYENEIPPMKFMGQIYRDNNLSQVLKILENAQVHFRIEDHTLIITNK